MKKKKISWKVLIWIILGLLLLGGIVYIVSTRLTGDAVAPNTAWCVDTDGGQAYDLPGICLQYKNTRGKLERSEDDRCVDTRRLIEYYCNSPAFPSVRATCAGQVITCSNGCSVSEEGSACN